MAATIYGIFLALSSTLLWVLWQYAVHAHLVRPDMADEELQLLTQRLTRGLGGYVVLIIVGLSVPVIAVIGYLAIALYYIIRRVGGMVTETDLALGRRRTLHVYDTGENDARLTVLWQHGSPNTGEPPAPLFPAVAARGIRWVSWDRPGYGGSTQQAGRDVAAAAADAADVADALGLRRFAVLGHSGGGPHALACAALLPDRVTAVVAMSGLAPMDAAGLDWFAGMAPGGIELLHAAAAGPVALKEYLAASEFDPSQFTPADEEALTGDWSWLAAVAGRAIATEHGGYPDDELAFVAPWGFDPGQITSPVLIVHGGQDRLVPSSHGEWLARRCPAAELWLRPDDGHVSVLRSGDAVLDWLTQQAG